MMCIVLSEEKKECLVPPRPGSIHHISLLFVKRHAVEIIYFFIFNCMIYLIYVRIYDNK